ncbi:MAG: o-succinylbenzoate synthase [Pseudomonadales bacterium]|nr:o-succinylbenzoate synthase [Pseudomonadales bacterium]
MKSAYLYRYRNPLYPELRLSNSITLRNREGLLIRLIEDGKEGWGEVAPLPGFSPETLRKVELLMPTLLQALLAQHSLLVSPTDSSHEVQVLASNTSGLPASIQFGISCALRELQCGVMGVEETPYHRNTPVFLVDGVDFSNAGWSRLVERISFSGSIGAGLQIKLKTGRDALEVDVNRYQRLVETFPGIAIRVDPNRRWSYESTLWFAQHIDQTRLAFLEEPCVSMKENAYLAQYDGLPIALDESTRETDFSLATVSWAKSIVIKPALQGLISQTETLVKKAQALEIIPVFSSSFESSVGWGQVAWLANHYAPEIAPGLDTLSRMQQCVVRKGPVWHDRPVVPREDLSLLWCAD